MTSTERRELDRAMITLADGLNELAVGVIKTAAEAERTAVALLRLSREMREE